MKEIDNSQVSKVLGQTVSYPKTYDPTILVRELRQNNRDHLRIEGDNLPFVGFDTWNAYECSTLNKNGVPVVGALKIIYSANSPYIVESKSLKLYLNSFNMSRSNHIEKSDVIETMCETIIEDLSNLLETDVTVSFFDSTLNAYDTNITPIFTVGEAPHYFENVDESLVSDDIVITDYSENPGLLIDDNDFDNMFNQTLVIKYHSALLKSNCRVTSQPDWGDVFVYMKTKGGIPTPLAFAKYIVSFRDECHFHEEICETIYTRLTTLFKPDELMVTCLYARRGGIDINPTRASHKALLPTVLGSEAYPHSKTQKQ